MQTIYNFLILGVFSILTIACGGEDDPTATNGIGDEIAGTWSVNSTTNSTSTILLDGLDLSSLFGEFELTINSDLTYSTNSDELINDSFPWPQVGSFTANDNGTLLTRDDGLEVSLTLSDDNTFMIMSFNYTTEFDNAGGRLDGVAGLWEFILVKN